MAPTRTPADPDSPTVSVALDLGPELAAQLREAARDRAVSVGKLVALMVEHTLPRLMPATTANLFRPEGPSPAVVPDPYRYGLGVGTGTGTILNGAPTISHGEIGSDPTYPPGTQFVHTSWHEDDLAGVLADLADPDVQPEPPMAGAYPGDTAEQGATDGRK